MRKRLQTVLLPYWCDINADGSVDYEYVRRFELIDEEEKEVKKFAKSDFRDGDVVEYRSGALRIVKDGKFYKNSNLLNTLDKYDKNLKSSEDELLDIVKVYRSIWEREELKITNAEKTILSNLDPDFKYIARDKSDVLYVYKYKPNKTIWSWEETRYDILNVFNHMFAMVKWEDEDPWLIEDLLKLPVKEDKE